SACCSSRNVQACTFGSTSRQRSRQARTKSSDVIAPSRISRAAAAADSSAACRSFAIKGHNRARRCPATIDREGGTSGGHNYWNPHFCGIHYRHMVLVSAVHEGWYGRGEGCRIIAVRL